MSQVDSPPVRAPVVARPADVEALAEVVLDAARSALPLRIAGAGRWLDAGRPVSAGAVLEVGGMRGVVDYVPGDLTITARAGTTLAELQDVVGANEQWIPLDPWGGDAGTLGATLATATAGPSAGAVGLPRDVVLGVEVVTGNGDIVRAGGRVVKNVAGFDLVRLMVGAWGTLGVISQATLRVRARPVCDESIALPLPRTSLPEWLQRLRHAPLQPAAMELVSGRLATQLGLGDEPLLLARIAGNAAAVAAQRATLAGFGVLQTVDVGAWERLRSADPDGSTVCRFSALPASLASVWNQAGDLLARIGEGWAHASVQRGVVRTILPPRPDELIAELFAASSAPAPFARRFERLSPELWPAIAPSPVRDELSMRVRAAFDPYNVLNPGILGDPVRERVGAES